MENALLELSLEREEGGEGEVNIDVGAEHRLAASFWGLSPQPRQMP